MVIKLYLNDPMGKKCLNIKAITEQLREKHGYDISVVKKSDCPSSCGSSLPSFPSVEIDGDVVFEGINIKSEELEREIVKRK